MFYSNFHLKKTGRFGLIWLAATQSKVLSRREVATINIKGACGEIIRHIPLKDGQARHASRFSLYLCCQLLYGTVKVFQKQWDFLLVDVAFCAASCDRKCRPETLTSAINLVAPRHGLTLESKVPTNKMDPNFDPLFGALKDLTPDVETILNTLDLGNTDDEQLTFNRFPSIVQPEIGSPHSVSDPKEIQIPDAEINQLNLMLPDEQDLPRMDHAGFRDFLSPQTMPGIENALMDMQEPGIILPSALDRPLFSDELERPIPVPETVHGIQDLQQGNTTFTEGNELSRIAALEETPLSKPGSVMPAPPRKQRPGKLRKTRTQTESDRGKQTGNNIDNVPQDQRILSPDNAINPQLPKSPHRNRHDWEQRNPLAVQLSPIIPGQSPLRKRRPHKLIIDTSLMISRTELREQMENTEDIISPMVLHFGLTESKNFYKEPAENVLQKNKDLGKLFTRNCQFGLHLKDSESESDNISSPGLLDIIRKRKQTRGHEEDDILPPKISRPSEEIPSLELGRDTSSTYSRSFDGRANLSHLTVVPSGDESSIRHRARSSSFHEKENVGEASIIAQDISTVSGQLPVWPEEPENISIVPIIELDNEPIPDQSGYLQEPIQFPHEIIEMVTGKSPNEDLGDGVLTLVKHHMKSNDDMTTFRTICPPDEFSKSAAASFFFDLCEQISQQKAFVRQEEPYGDIYIWLPEVQEDETSQMES